MNKADGLLDPLFLLQVFTARRRQNVGLSASGARIPSVRRSPERTALGFIQAPLHNPPFMQHTRSGSDILVRIDPGEEIHTSLKKLADDLGFDAAAITSGIGRTRENQYGYMNEEGVYKRRLLDSPSELVSLSGNIARTENGDAFTHIHCCWSDDENNVHAGHMFESTVHVVAEVHVRVMEHASMTRCPLANAELLGLEFD